MSHYGYLAHSELYHHGVKGMRWGIRNYQNPDGTLTDAGRKHYGINERRQLRVEMQKRADAGKMDLKVFKTGLIYEKPYKMGEYRHPKTREDAINIIKFDRDTYNGKPGMFTKVAGSTFLNPRASLINHYQDNKGKIALSYCDVPKFGRIYVKGPGNINDLRLNEMFVHPPKKYD